MGIFSNKSTTPNPTPTSSVFKDQKLIKEASRVFSNKISRDELRSGDHVYSWRNAYLYSHHGIYTGDGKVIHFTRGPDQETGTGTFIDNIIVSSSASSDRSKPLCAVCGDQSNLSGVISSCLDCFLWNGELYRFDYGVSPVFFLAKARGGTCTLAPSDPAEDALKRATFLLENGFGGYNIFNNNCEDFAIYCKTGLLIATNNTPGRSGQCTAAMAAVTAIVSSPLRLLTTSFSGLAAVGCGMYCFSRFLSDIGVRRDVMKVPVERLANVNPVDLDQPQPSKRPKTETETTVEDAIHLDQPQPAKTETQTAREEPVNSDQPQPAKTEAQTAREDPVNSDQPQPAKTEAQTAREDPVNSDQPQPAKTEAQTAREDPIDLDQPQSVKTETQPAREDPVDSDQPQPAKTETETSKEDLIDLDQPQPAKTETAKED